MGRGALTAEEERMLKRVDGRKELQTLKIFLKKPWGIILYFYLKLQIMCI